MVRSRVSAFPVCVLSAIGLTVAAAQAAGAADLDGTMWTTEGGDAQVAFAEEGDGLVGRIVWLADEAESGEPVFDANNPDPALQARPLVGVPMVWGFTQTRDAVWDKGNVYAPDDGKTYNAKMTLEDDALVITGCIRWPLCRDTTWTRTAAAAP